MVDKTFSYASAAPSHIPPGPGYEYIDITGGNVVVYRSNDFGTFKKISIFINDILTEKNGNVISDKDGNVITRV